MNIFIPLSASYIFFEFIYLCRVSCHPGKYWSRPSSLLNFGDRRSYTTTAAVCCTKHSRSHGFSHLINFLYFFSRFVKRKKWTLHRASPAWKMVKNLRVLSDTCTVAHSLLKSLHEIRGLSGGEDDNDVPKFFPYCSFYSEEEKLWYLLDEIRRRRGVNFEISIPSSFPRSDSKRMVFICRDMITNICGFGYDRSWNTIWRIVPNIPKYITRSFNSFLYHGSPIYIHFRFQLVKHEWRVRMNTRMYARKCTRMHRYFIHSCTLFVKYISPWKTISLFFIPAFE